MSYIRIGDIDVHYESYGKGEHLILLHGLLGSIESDWFRLIKTLSQKFHVIAVDLRGHGQTNNPKAELRNSYFCGDLTGLLDTLGIKSAFVCGYSLGGYIGLMAGINQTDLIRALVMHASKMFWNKMVIESMLARFDPDLMMAKVPTFAEKLQNIHGKERWKALLSEATYYVRTLLSEVTIPKDTSSIDFPILVSVGDRDDFVPLNEALSFSKLLPKGELLVMPNTRHSIDSIREEVFIPAILDFFKRH